MDARSREGEGNTTVLNFWLGLGNGGISERECDLEPVGLLGRGECCEEGGGWGKEGNGVCRVESAGDGLKGLGGGPGLWICLGVEREGQVGEYSRGLECRRLDLYFACWAGSCGK